MNTANPTASMGSGADADVRPLFSFRNLGEGLRARSATWLALRGIIALLVGGAVLAMPGMALFGLAMVFAAFVLADGVLSLFSGVAKTGVLKGPRWALILSGVLSIAVAAAFFAFPLLGTVAYGYAAVVLVAAWAVLTGGLEMAAGWRLRREIEGDALLIVSGALSVILGALVLAMLLWVPALTLLSLAAGIGIFAITSGIVLLVAAWRQRKRPALQEPAA